MRRFIAFLTSLAFLSGCTKSLPVQTKVATKIEAPKKVEPQFISTENQYASFKIPAEFDYIWQEENMQFLAAQKDKKILVLVEFSNEFDGSIADAARIIMIANLQKGAKLQNVRTTKADGHAGLEISFTRNKLFSEYNVFLDKDVVHIASCGGPEDNISNVQYFCSKFLETYKIKVASTVEEDKNKF